MSLAGLADPTRAATAERIRAFLAHGVCGREIGCPDRQLRELPRGLVNVREVAPSVVVLPAPAWCHPEARLLVRPEVGSRLHEAASRLPDDIRLGLWEGLRPVTVQQRLWRHGLEYLRGQNPHLPASDLELMLELFVARPDGVQPPHSTGSAVDIAPVNAFGQALQPSDAWGRVALDVVSAALRETGLANYAPEWWHWSYGDEEWARTFDCRPLPFALAPEFDGPGGGI